METRVACSAGAGVVHEPIREDAAAIIDSDVWEELRLGLVLVFGEECDLQSEIGRRDSCFARSDPDGIAEGPFERQWKAEAASKAATSARQRFNWDSDLPSIFSATSGVFFGAASKMPM